MLKVKHLTLFKPKNWKKGGNFYQGCKKNRALLCSICICNLASRYSLILTKIWFSIECIFFKFAICSIALLNLGGTCHLKGRGMVTVWCTVLLLCCYDCESTQQHYDITLLEYVLWCHTMHEWVMNIHYQNMNRPRAIHKHHPHPLETKGHVW